MPINPDFPYGDPLYLATLLKQQIKEDRPDALVALTSNPGKEADHYIGLALRVYQRQDNLFTFKGYIVFRFNEVKWKRKTSNLPEFSSIELRDRDFNEFNPPKKIHFHPVKVAAEDPHLEHQVLVDAKSYLQKISSFTNTAPTNDDLRDIVRNFTAYARLGNIYPTILDLIDGKF